MTSEPTAAPLRHAARRQSRALAWAVDHRWPLLVWGAMAAWSLGFFATVRTAYATFQLPRYDLGNMVQTVWNTAHGHPLEMTHTGGEQAARLASHVDPVLALVTPLWLVAPTPLTLAAVQITACALGALPVFWLGRRHLDSEAAAALLAVAYLVYPWLAWTAVEAFHPVTLAIPLFLFALWFLDSGRLWAFALCAALAASTGELMGLPIAGLGIWYWLARGHRVAGVAIALAGAAWTAVALEVIVPAAAAEGASPFYDRFASVGGSPTGLIETAFTDPAAILSAIFTVDELAYALWLGIPLAGAFLLAPVLAAVALPQLLVNALAESTPTTDPRTHYIAAIVPFLVGASVLGVARLPREHRLPAAAFVLALCSALSLLVGQLLTIPGVKQPGYQAELPATHVEALRAAVATVSDDEPVSTTNRVGAHLSARRYVYAVPVLAGEESARWIVLDTWDALVAKEGASKLEWDPEALRRFRGTVDGSGEWKKVFEEDGVLVFKKKGS
jgi:uncharacterized membrane protein